ncbi:MAG: thiamine-phosphate kinase, partial [Thermoproteota archaeon]|nr:thiamine-phosphate kinase [Thermoproteota archaeon]
KLDEKQIIRIFANKLGISNLNDVALLDKGIVMKSDMLVASTDIPSGMEAWQAARKSIVACVSDLAAKGVRPHAAVISLGIPSSYSMLQPYIEGLAEGFATASKEFGVKIVGGDTNEAAELVIDCSMIGFSTFKVPTRSGAKPGDYLIVSGPFGFAPAGLAILLQNAITVSSNSSSDSVTFRKHAVKSVLEPYPRQSFGLALARYFSSSIDSSDGLAVSLYELASQSEGVDIIIYNIPFVEGLDEFAQENSLDKNELVFHGGEEYEIVATISPTTISQAEAAARKAGVNLHVIGKVEKGSGKVFARNRLLENRGYMHLHK